MKNKRCVPDLAVLFFLLTLFLALCSWVGSIYGAGEVQSLLSVEGIRWMLGHIMDNYVQASALGIVLVLLMGGGIVVQSGLYDVLKRLCRKEGKLSRKERRALGLALVTFFIYVSLIGVCLALPSNLLLGVTGSWLYSPLVEGSAYLLAVGVGVSGIVYGYVADVFRVMRDWIGGMTILIARKASYFVTLFFVAQFFSSLVYTRLPDYLHLSEGFVEVLFQVCCYFPLCFWQKK